MCRADGRWSPDPATLVCTCEYQSTVWHCYAKKYVACTFVPRVQYNTCTFSVDCGPPGSPQRGSTNYTGTTEGSVVFYRCDQHLVPEGRMRANCTRNGWSPIDPGRLSCSVGTLTED